MMSFQAKRELLTQVAARYSQASGRQKSLILDEFVAATGYQRKYAIRLLRRPPPVSPAIKRQRARRYGLAVQDALKITWAAANFICAKAVYDSFGPVRLLQQIVVLQDALWHLAVVSAPTIVIASLDAATTPETRFNRAACGLGATRSDESLGAADSQTTPAASAAHKARRYRRTNQPPAPHTWRKPSDPIESVWEEVRRWLAANPGRTAQSILRELQERYPEQFPDLQLRTMQRRVRAWRAQCIEFTGNSWSVGDPQQGGVVVVGRGQVGSWEATTLDHDLTVTYGYCLHLGDVRDDAACGARIPPPTATNTPVPTAMPTATSAPNSTPVPSPTPRVPQPPAEIPEPAAFLLLLGGLAGLAGYVRRGSLAKRRARARANESDRGAS